MICNIGMVDSDTIRAYAKDLESEDPKLAKMTRQLADYMDESL